MKNNYWSMMGPGKDGAAISDEINRLEDMGFTGVVVPQTYAPPFVHIAAAAMANPNMELATGIAIASTRSPFETACAAIEVDRISNGRFRLGLGVAPNHWLDYYGTEKNKPVSRVKEVIEVIRHVETHAARGEMAPFEGEFWNLKFESFEPFVPPLRPQVPIYVAALRERVCELVGECADGLIGHPMWSVDYALGTAQEAVKRGAEKTGRDAQQIDLQSYVVISVDEDEKQALDRARAFVAFYGAFAQYYDYFEQHGFGDVVKRLSEAAKTQSCAEYAHLVPDEMVRTFTASGTREQVEEWIEPLWQKASTVVLGIPVWGLAPEEIAKAQIAAESFVKSSA